jgi:hypothetical protein
MEAPDEYRHPAAAPRAPHEASAGQKANAAAPQMYVPAAIRSTTFFTFETP